MDGSQSLSPNAHPTAISSKRAPLAAHDWAAGTKRNCGHAGHSDGLRHALLAELSMNKIGETQQQNRRHGLAASASLKSHAELMQASDRATIKPAPPVEAKLYGVNLIDPFSSVGHGRRSLTQHGAQHGA